MKHWKTSDWFKMIQEYFHFFQVALESNYIQFTIIYSIEYLCWSRWVVSTGQRLASHPLYKMLMDAPYPRKWRWDWWDVEIWQVWWCKNQHRITY
jgi:hypothetical protein